jgi:DNA repair protein SbcD/Mre11
MFKFLHAADIHLDSPQRGLDRYEGAPVAECRGATRAALENLVKLAVDEKVAFVLIVGDLYDGDWIDFQTPLFFCKQMSRLRDAGIPVFLIRGNHDAANHMTRDLRLPDNVTMLDVQRPETKEIEHLGVAIHGQGFARRDVTENLAKSYPARTAGLFNIGLLHTNVGGREGHENYAPCSIDDMRRHEYDYWALGHIHTSDRLHAIDPVIAYPGNVQGRSIRETGAKGCLLVSVDDARKVMVEPRALDVMRWRLCRVDASAARDDEEVLQRFRDQLVTILPESESRLMALRVEVHGACPAHAKLSADWLRFSTELRQTTTDASNGRAWVEKIVAKTSAPADRGAFADDGPLDELRAFLDELRGDDAKLKALGDASLVDLKPKLDQDLLDGLDTPERLRELLDQVGPLLLDRLAPTR